MTAANPVRMGLVLATTVGIAYAACALVFWLWPEAAMGYMNALFHGVDFRRLQAGPALFNFGSFIYALVVSVVWAFVLGVIFGLMQGLFLESRGRG